MVCLWNCSTRLEQQNGHLAQVEVDEMLGLVGHVASKIPPHNAVPGGIILLSTCGDSYLLDVGGDVLLDIVLLQRLGRALHRVLLHLLRHVGIFNHGFSVGHGSSEGERRQWAVQRAGPSRDEAKRRWSSALLRSKLLTPKRLRVQT
ncbi:hypothetical protein GN956_G10073 [Arapaima gigas]